MNAPQFGTALTSSALPAGNASLANFLLASSTNSGVGAPDFKTVAASFFATPAATSPNGQPVPPSSPTTTKSVGASKPGERETNKGKDTQDSDVPSLFLPIIPAHLLNLVPPQYQVVSHPIASEFPKNSEAPIDTTIPTTTVSVTSPLQFASQTMPTESQPLTIRQNFPSLHDLAISTADLKSNTFREVSPARTNHEYQQQIAQGPDATPQSEDVSVDRIFSVPEELSQSRPDAAIGVSQQQPLAIAEQTPEMIQPNNIQGKQAIPQTPRTSATKTESTASIAVRFSPRPDFSEISTRPTRLTTDQPAPKVATNTAHREVIEHKSVPAAPRAEEIPAPSSKPRLDSVIEPAPLKKDLTPKQDHRPENSTSKQADSTVEIDPVPQSPLVVPQSVTDVVKAAFVGTAVLGNELPRKSTFSNSEINLISIHPTQSSSSVQATAQTEPQVVQPDAPTTALKNDPSTRTSIPASTPVVASTIKSAAIKSRAEAASKSKTQRVNADTQEDGSTNITEPHQHEVRSVSALQNTTDTGTNKNHDTVAPLGNAAPHTKLESTKNAPGVLDFTPANTTQHPEIDDAIPAAHTSINTAKLVQGLSQSELRVGLQTRDFGNIDIRTSVSRHEFSAQISVEHGDVARTLTTELPDLYARLNEQQVSVSSIHIQNQGLSTSSGLDQHSQQSSHSQSSGITRSQQEPALPVIQEVLSPTDRLDIRI